MGRRRPAQERDFRLNGGRFRTVPAMNRGQPVDPGPVRAGSAAVRRRPRSRTGRRAAPKPAERPLTLRGGQAPIRVNRPTRAGGSRVRAHPTFSLRGVRRPMAEHLANARLLPASYPAQGLRSARSGPRPPGQHPPRPARPRSIGPGGNAQAITATGTVVGLPRFSFIGARCCKPASSCEQLTARRRSASLSWQHCTPEQASPSQSPAADSS